MQKKRPYIAPLIASLALCVVADASAMGFGRVPQAAVLGQPLDFSVSLRLEPGETVPPQCVTAEVAVGDQRLSPAQVRARVDGGDTPEATLRVVSLMSIDEPVVTVNVAVGCPVKLSRRFVVFADPLPASFSAPLTYQATPPTNDAPPTTVVQPPASVPADRAVLASPAEPDRRIGESAPQAKASAPRAPRVAKVGGGGRRTGEAAAPRLKLDAAEPPPSNAALAAAAASAAEAREAEVMAVAAAAAASAASAAADRISALERSIEKLRADTQADRDAMSTMRSRAAEAEMMARWTPYLLVLVALLGLGVAWLLLKIRALNNERQQDWMKATAVTSEAPVAVPSRVSTQMPSEFAADPPSPPPFIPTRPGTPTGLMSGADDADADSEPEPWTQRTQRLPPPPPRDDGQGSRAVSIEELIDLEQQAEFFIVLGQEEAAIDLLVDHLRSTGGGSPLPYLKLLEIYKRRSEREAYDRTRARFNHRFNAVAPDWDEDVQQGRLLEDYPNIIARLQMAWSTPLDAMAELESLLFRKSRGELFDMPAYRDLLFLYSLSRDLLDREPLDSGNVDVLLPLSEGATFTEPMPLDESPEGLPSGLLDFEAQPTVPVDLDLTQPAMPDSIFGDPTQHLRRR